MFQKIENSVKPFWFDGNGLILIHKKLEQGIFMSFDKLYEVEHMADEVWQSKDLQL